MANLGFYDTEIPRRPWRGPPPRLYVIARKSPFPWLRIRRLGEADRAALMAHLGRQAKAARHFGHGLPDEARIAALCAGLDFTRLVVFGAIAGNAVVAAACGMPGLNGLEVAATEDADYRDRDLGRMLASQVLDAGWGAGLGVIALANSPDDMEHALLRLLQCCGMSVEQDAATEEGITGGHEHAEA